MAPWPTLGMENDDNETWVRFSEVGINARMRNALELFALKERGEQLSPPVCRDPREEAAGLERVPAALTGWGAGDAAGLTSEVGTPDGDKLRKLG